VVTWTTVLELQRTHDGRLQIVVVDSRLFAVAFAGEDGLDLDAGLRIDERLVGVGAFDALEGDDTSDKVVSHSRTGIREWLPRLDSNQHRRFSPVWQTT